jgi:hypothetical protein
MGASGEGLEMRAASGSIPFQYYRSVHCNIHRFGCRLAILQAETLRSHHPLLGVFYRDFPVALLMKMCDTEGIGFRADRERQEIGLMNFSII